MTQVVWQNFAYLSHRYLLDMLCMYIITMSVKMFAASHRPHFFETCMPDALMNCTLGTLVNEYSCTNKNAHRFDIYDASWSFFSGHAATCVYSTLFIVWYVHKRFDEKLLWTPVIQAFLICFGLYGSLSRVFDHRHHWWDVLTGVLVGFIATCHACYILCENKCTPERGYHEKKRKVTDPNEIVSINIS